MTGASGSLEPEIGPCDYEFFQCVFEDLPSGVAVLIRAQQKLSVKFAECQRRVSGADEDVTRDLMIGPPKLFDVFPTVGANATTIVANGDEVWP